MITHTIDLPIPPSANRTMRAGSATPMCWQWRNVSAHVAARLLATLLRMLRSGQAASISTMAVKPSSIGRSLAT